MRWNRRCYQLWTVVGDVQVVAVAKQNISVLGYSVFGYFEHLQDCPLALNVHGPAGTPVFTTLAPRSPPSLGVTTGVAHNFYALADSQVLMGFKFAVYRRELSWGEANYQLFVTIYNE